jgi:hypothetical protein
MKNNPQQIEQDQAAFDHFNFKNRQHDFAFCREQKVRFMSRNKRLSVVLCVSTNTEQKNLRQGKCRRQETVVHILEFR